MPLVVAALLVSPPSRAEGVSVSDATSAQRKSADKKLAEGQKLFKAGKLEEAVAAFEAAHEIVANPEARLMIARAHQNLGELVKAHADYLAAVAEGERAAQHNDKYRDTLQSARKELKELEGVLARVTINLRHAPSGTKVVIDGEPLDTSELGTSKLLAPGAIEIIATAPDGREVSRKLTLTAGQDAKIDLAFTRDGNEPVAPTIVEEGAETPPPTEPASAPSSGKGKRTAAFIAGGAGIAGLATFGVFGALSNSKYNSLDKACASSLCPPDRQSDIDAGKRYQTLANIGLAVGVVGVGASAVLFVLGSGDSNAAAKDAGSARLQLGIGVGSILVRGRFQ